MLTQADPVVAPVFVTVATVGPSVTYCVNAVFKCPVRVGQRASNRN